VSCVVVVVVVVRSGMVLSTYNRNAHQVLQIWYVMAAMIFTAYIYAVLVFVFMRCYFNIISELLKYFTYVRSISQGISHQTYSHTAPTSRQKTILIHLMFVSPCIIVQFK
jgi:hypothetical protein